MRIRSFVLVGLLMAGLIVFWEAMGVNHNGYRVVVQRPTGYTFVKTDPGFYFQWFGTVTEYPDYITYDFNKEPSSYGAERSIAQPGIPVRYQDGGQGTVYGLARFVLPTDPDTMMKLHKAFRSPEGLASKLLKATTEERVSLTAGLMTSEEAYNSKRSVFTEWARDQIAIGKYKTTLQTREVKEEGTEHTVTVDFPVIEMGKDGRPLYLDNDLKQYGITLGSLQFVNPDFEAKTVEQIQVKRAATMQIITKRAEAEAANQAALTAEAEGKRNVTIAQYEKEVDKQKAVTEAEQNSAVAIIKAKQMVSVAEQAKNEQAQKTETAALYKQEQTARGEGDAAYNKAVIESDGALKQKLEAYKFVMSTWAENVGKQRWVPEVQFGATTTGNGSQANVLMDMLTAKAAKDLSLDLGVKGQTQEQK
jgi:regulator of protease activity HflC (stomatin/prohibitin superfamily)